MLLKFLGEAHRLGQGTVNRRTEREARSSQVEERKEEAFQASGKA